MISDSIRVNTNFRIALRVADDDESTDVVGVPSAAHIDRNTPGRAVCRVGPKEIQPFQAGYVSGRTSLERLPIEVGVRHFGLGGDLEQRAMDFMAETGDSEMFSTRNEFLVDARDCSYLIVRDQIQIDSLSREEDSTAVASRFDDDVPAVPFMKLAYGFRVVREQGVRHSESPLSRNEKLVEFVSRTIRRFRRGDPFA